MRSRPLFAQVLTVNLLLVAGTVLVATLALDVHGVHPFRGGEVPVLAAALVATLLGNWLLLHRRFEPLEDIISTMESLDLAVSRPQRVALPRADLVSSNDAVKMSLLADVGQRGPYPVLEAGITLLFRWLGQEHLTWARVVQTVAAFCFSASFVIQAGSELVRDLLDAIALVRDRLRRF